MLDIPVPQVGLQSAGIVPRICQGEAAGMPEHVRMNLEPDPRGLRRPLNHSGKAGSRERRAPLAYEHEGASLALPLQTPEGSHLRAAQRVNARGALFGPTDVQDCAIKIDLIPTKVPRLKGPQPMPEGD